MRSREDHFGEFWKCWMIWCENALFRWICTYWREKFSLPPSALAFLLYQVVLGGALENTRSWEWMLNVLKTLPDGSEKASFRWICTFWYQIFSLVTSALAYLLSFTVFEGVRENTRSREHHFQRLIPASDAVQKCLIRIFSFTSRRLACFVFHIVLDGTHYKTGARESSFWWRLKSTVWCSAEGTFSFCRYCRKIFSLAPSLGLFIFPVSYCVPSPWQNLEGFDKNTWHGAKRHLLKPCFGAKFFRSRVRRSRTLCFILFWRLRERYLRQLENIHCLMRCEKALLHFVRLVA